MTKEEVLEKHCPSTNNLFLDKKGRAFRDRILKAMEEHAESVHVSRLLSAVPSVKEINNFAKRYSDTEDRNEDVIVGAVWVLEYIKQKQRGIAG
jgi:PHP family Zn ribbon phosphoesterase